MRGTINSDISELNRSATVLSRFSERFSDESDHPSICATFVTPTNIVRALRIERDLQRKRTTKSLGKYSGLGRSVCEDRQRRHSIASALARERRRASAKTIYERHRQAKRVRRGQEKKHKQKSRWSGTVWGHDPVAGRVLESVEKGREFEGCYVFRGIENSSDEYGADELDALGRRSGRQWLHGSKWGIEFGGPSRLSFVEPFDVNQISFTKQETENATEKGKAVPHE